MFIFRKHLFFRSCLCAINMHGRGYTVMPKVEWDRLKKQAGEVAKSDEVKHCEDRQEYLRTLNQKSQEWITSWPDSLQGFVDKVAKQKERRNERNMKMVNDYKALQELKKLEKFDNIAKAKQRIFDASGYGKELITALVASRTLEERDAQIKFQKEIRQQELELENKFGSKGNSLELGHDNEEDVKARKDEIKNVEQINRKIHKSNQERQAKEKEADKLLELKDSRTVEKLLEFEAHAKDHCQEKIKRMTEEFAEDQKRFRESRAVREKLDEDIAQVWRNYYDRVACKERAMMDRMHISKHNQPHMKVNYELTEKLHNDANQRYEDFINKGIERAEQELVKKDQEKAVRDKLQKEMLLQRVEQNKNMVKKQEAIKKCSKTYCDRQSLFTKECERKVVNALCYDGDDQEGVYQPPPYHPYKRCNYLEQALRKREQDPSPWNGTEASHEYFAKQAGDVLAQCKYKHFARKVVDDYWKANGLNETTLPVDNY